MYILATFFASSKTVKTGKDYSGSLTGKDDEELMRILATLFFARSKTASSCRNLAAISAFTRVDFSTPTL